MKPFYKTMYRFALASLLAVPMVVLSPPSQANITITPTIVVIEGRARYADVNLLNITGAPHTYAIGWRFMKMTSDEGRYDNVDKSLTDFDLTKNIVYTPKRVTVEPNAVQKIRLGLRLKGEPPTPGDYRAHLELVDVSEKGTPIEPPKVPPGADPAQKPVTMGIRVNVGFSIPVIYRVGESTASPVLGTISTGLDKHGRPEVIIPVTKVGGTTYGVYGQIKVFYEDKKVGEVNNANIFPEGTSRTFKIPLSVPKLSGGSIRIVYKHFSPQNDTIYAEKTIPVGE